MTTSIKYTTLKKLHMTNIPTHLSYYQSYFCEVYNNDNDYTTTSPQVPLTHSLLVFMAFALSLCRLNAKGT